MPLQNNQEIATSDTQAEQLLHELGTHCATPVWGLSARAREEISVQPDCTKPAPQP